MSTIYDISWPKNIKYKRELNTNLNEIKMIESNWKGVGVVVWAMFWVLLVSTKILECIFISGTIIYHILTVSRSTICRINLFLNKKFRFLVFPVLALVVYQIFSIDRYRTCHMMTERRVKTIKSITSTLTYHSDYSQLFIVTPFQYRKSYDSIVYKLVSCRLPLLGILIIQDY